MVVVAARLSSSVWWFHFNNWTREWEDNYVQQGSAALIGLICTPVIELCRNSHWISLIMWFLILLNVLLQFIGYCFEPFVNLVNNWCSKYVSQWIILYNSWLFDNIVLFLLCCTQLISLAPLCLYRVMKTCNKILRLSMSLLTDQAVKKDWQYLISCANTLRNQRHRSCCFLCWCDCHL